MPSLIAISPALQLLLTAALLSDSDVSVTFLSDATSLQVVILPTPAVDPTEPRLVVITPAQGMILNMPLTDAAAAPIVAIGKQGTVGLILGDLPAPYAPL